MENLTLNNRRQPPIVEKVDTFFQPAKPEPVTPQQVFQQEMPQEMMEQPQHMMDEDDELDPEFIGEIETYLKECMENNELSIDMSDTLIKDHGAKMVAAAASLCDQLQELRLQQCGITDEGAIELFSELRVLP